ncbi:MAG: glycosyltransferase family 2 protein [Deltaproteobacteria bacterium]|nr:glycosyltransferase family 2 protein [Deltaproteobacteria bacterium]
MADTPCVSVIIPSYNRRSFVAEAVESVLAQDYGNIECIVVDDGSTDGTKEFLAGKYGASIKYLYQKNKDKCVARNYGIRESKGEYLMMLDSDDLFCKGAVKAMLTCFDSHDNADAVYGLTLKENEEGKTRYMAERKWPEGDIFDAYMKDRFLNNDCFMIKREAMLKHGMYSEEITNFEDIELHLRLTSILKFYFCGEYTCVVRSHGERERASYEKVLTQGVRAMDVLFTTKGLSQKILNVKKKLYAEQYLSLALMAYKAGLMKKFRGYFYDSLGYNPMALFKGRFLRRYLISFIK